MNILEFLEIYDKKGRRTEILSYFETVYVICYTISSNSKRDVDTSHSKHKYSRIYKQILLKKKTPDFSTFTAFKKPAVYLVSFKIMYKN